MLCPRCEVEMVTGIAIKPNKEFGAFYIVPVALTTADALEVIKCLKCPVCGHSDTGTFFEENPEYQKYSI